LRGGSASGSPPRINWSSRAATASLYKPEEAIDPRGGVRRDGVDLPGDPGDVSGFVLCEQIMLAQANLLIQIRRRLTQGAADAAAGKGLDQMSFGPTSRDVNGKPD
jgi:hypothetical protein